MKRILYVTPLVVGFQDILEGKNDSRGLPSFILPLKRMLDSEEYIVDIVLISNFKEDYNINVDWVKAENIVGNINNDLTTNNLIIKSFRKLKSIIELFILLNEYTKKHKYDLIYCHGKAAIIGNLIAWIKNIKCGYRLYGVVSLYEELKRNKVKAIIKNITYTLIFKMPKDFMIITDDGTDGDKVYEIMKPKHHDYDFRFLVNGVDQESYKDIKSSSLNLHKPFIFHAARIDPIKRQDRSICILEGLVSKGLDLKLLLAGHYEENETYYKSLLKILKEKNLEDRVEFLGPVPRNTLKATGYEAIANIFMGDYSNNGNVFYEIFSTGGVCVALDFPNIKKYIINDETGYLVKNDEEAINCISELFKKETQEILTVKQKAIEHSKKLLLNWEKRVDLEIEIIEKNIR